MSNLKKFVAGFSTIALAMSMIFVAAPVADAATAGGVYKTTDGTVWFVTEGMQRRAFTSAGAFMSYGFLSFSQVAEADASVTALPAGSFIAPQDGRIFCATETKASDVAGECSLITGGKKAAFTSATVFTQQGYSFARAYYGDSSFLEKTSNIDNGSAQHRPGTLINNNGTVQLVVTGGLWGVPSMDVFNSWGWSFADVVPANSADVLLSQTGVIPARQAGQLVPTASTTPVNPGDCNLSGNAGSIEVESSSLYSDEQIAEGEDDKGVMAFDVTADNDSDVAVTSVKVELTFTDDAVLPTASNDLEDYAGEVKVWYGDEEVGSSDVEDFTETSGVYTKNISLDCAEVGADETAEFSVSVSANSTIDSSDLSTSGDLDNNTWTADVLSVRFEDADGVTTTLDSADFIDALAQDFSFVDFATATDIELKASLTSDMEDINDAHSITIDDEDRTDKEEVLAFTLKANGDSDIWVDEIPVTITSSAPLTESTVVYKAYLYNGTTLVGSETVVDNVDVVFDDLDMTIDSEDSEDFTVKLDLQPQAAPTGTIITAVNVANIDAEDQEGDTVAPADLTGSATSGAHTLTLSASTLDLGDTGHSQNEAGTLGTYTFEVTVTAEDEDIVVASTTVLADSITGATVAAVPSASISVLKTSGSTTGDVNNYTVVDGNTATFIITVTLDPGASGAYYIRLNSIDGLTTTDADRVNGPESLVA